MGDLYCKKCGEPWDAYGVFLALRGGNGDMTKEEAERFLRGEGCPSCDFGKKVRQRTPEEEEDLELAFLEALIENWE